uniref:Uncharacterized protein n=1 Tax=uncultured prokaryote TaxID=198431 RepID=A0A0H5QJA0_9ZZZZ|nr:hypothetical protein [uncultured prokaryote]
MPPKPLELPAQTTTQKIEAALEQQLIGFSHSYQRTSRDGKRIDFYTTSFSIKAWEIFAGLFTFGLWELGNSISKTLAGLDPLNIPAEVGEYVAQLVDELEGKTPPAPPPANLSMMGFLEAKVIADWGNISALITGAIGQAKGGAGSEASNVSIPQPIQQAAKDLLAVPVAVASAGATIGKDLGEIPAAVASVPAEVASVPSAIVSAVEAVPAEAEDDVASTVSAIKKLLGL